MDAWRKSTFSSGGGCVEVADGGPVVHVRDSKDRGAGPVLSFDPDAWAAFLAGVRAGQFD